jgi:general L-amino acid transport system substrate-binding protein
MRWNGAGALALMAGLAVSLGLAQPATAQGSGSATLDAAKTRAQILCGVSGQVPGFSLPDSQGVMRGLDADTCRAVAAAAIGDATKVKFVPTTTQNRFTALQSGEIDVLSRNSTYTIGRDTSLGLDFVAVNYYDGQGFIVHKSLGVKSAKELNGASICTETGTTTELNIADYFRSHKMEYKAIAFSNNDEAVAAYDAGRCDVYTTDQSGLYANRLKMAKPEENIVLPDIISKEPLGPVVRHGDNQWGDIVRWAHYAMVTGEEMGITSANAKDMLKSENPEIKRLLGVDDNLGQGMGLPKEWAFNILSQVGNYAESFERNVGAKSPLGIARGLNALWSQGGLQYAPPAR